MSKNKYSTAKIDGKRYKFRDELSIAAKLPEFQNVSSIDEVPFFKNGSDSASLINSLDGTIQVQQDLAYGTCIYVSEGENANGAYFLRDELIKARKTPILKPVDIEHNPDIIVGVMYDAAIATQSGKPVYEKDILFNEETGKFSIIGENGQKINEKIDILTSFVLYKYMFPEVVEEVSKYQGNQEKNGKYYVSMEVFYNEFGYIFNRDESTLIKIENNLAGKELYKRYEQYVNKIAPDGRHVSKVYFNFTFGGVGIVEQPANKRSYLLDLAIKNNKDTLVVDKESTGTDNTHTNNFKNLSREEEMLNGEEKAAIEKLVTKAMASNPEISPEEARIGILEKRIEDLTKDNAGLNAELDSAKDKIVVLSSKAEEIEKGLTEKVADYEQSIASKEDEVTKLKASLEQAIAELTSIKQEKLGLDRIAELETAGVKFGERRDNVLSRVSKMSDEDFASYKDDMLLVVSTAAKCGEKEEEKAEDKKVKDEEKMKKEEKQAKAEEEEDDTEEDGDDIDADEAKIDSANLKVDKEIAEDFAALTSAKSDKDITANYDSLMAEAFKKVTTRDKGNIRGSNNKIF